MKIEKTEIWIENNTDSREQTIRLKKKDPSSECLLTEHLSSV